MGDTRRRLRMGMVGGGQGAFIGAVPRMAARIDFVSIVTPNSSHAAIAT